MCGIAGTLDLEPLPVSGESLVAEMTDVLGHRGPDDAGLLVDPPVVLGNRRLSILDLSPAGHQPMGTEDGRLWLTYNGEIYNYREVASELRSRGHRFRSSGDTEVLLRAYGEWGQECLARLNGMFAFALWDRSSQELFCARDRFGVKPFYYTVVGGRFRFASEIKALLMDQNVSRCANDARVLDFLARAISDHTAETMFEGIYQLPAGSYMRASAARGLITSEWYRLRPAESDGRHAGDAVREILTDAVSLRLRSDVPVGTLLSGGLDSSSVTALASILRHKDGATPPDSFTARSRNARIDESRYSQSVAEMTGSRNQEIWPDEGNLLEDLDHLLWYMDEPFHTASTYAHWQLMKTTRDAGITVVLDGSGGDEAFLGYHFLLYPSVYFALLGRGRVLSAIREHTWRRRRNDVPWRQSGWEGLRFVLPHRLRAARRPPWIDADAPIPARPTPRRTLQDHQRFALTVSPLPMHNREDDRSSMSFSLEMRNPFLDYRIVEYGLALEPGDLLHQGLSKWVLREAVRGVLPAQVVDRPDKQGFTTDEANWLRRGDLGSEGEAIFRSDSFSQRPYFDRDALLAMLAEHRRGQDFTLSLWRAFVVERWLRLFVDPGVLRPPSGTPLTVRAQDRVTRLEEDSTPASSDLDR